MMLSYLCFFLFMYFIFSLSLFDHFAVAHIFAHFTCSIIQPLCHESEHSALLQFNESLTINVPGAVAGFSKGVTCNNHTGRITRIDLSSARLSDHINSTSTLFHFVHLEWLSLADNEFHNSKIPATIKNFQGELPFSIGNLAFLKELHVTGCKLSGLISSSLGNLTQLTGLAMGENQLTGPIPSSLMNNNQLSLLLLESNQLTGQIPSEIRNLTQLIYLDLSSNSLQELIFSSNNLSMVSKTSVDTSIRKLDILELCSCNLNEFPNALRNQDWLYKLDLSSNKISGQIPRWFLNLRIDALEYLNLSNNLLTGYNKLQGPLPLPPPSTNHYLISNNMLNGGIPPQICSLKGLYTLNLSNNNLSGVLPRCLGSFSYDLSILALRGNKFHESIPQTFMNGTNLKMIDLSDNNLKGRIPISLVNCTKPEFLHLGNNQITEVFPSWLAILPELQVLILKSNRSQGVIKEPKTSFEFPKLHVTDLSHDTFREITASIASLIGLKSLNLSQNNLQGHIPLSLGNLTALESLDLSNNNLSGEIPQQLANLTYLVVFDVSHNHLIGGLIVGVVLGQEFYRRKHEWFVKTFRIHIVRGGPL
ncbi:hypothetical protein ACOSQ2_002907 [Xanthoceras sorbifolium]